MVASRILFLSTYDTTMDFKNLIEDHSLADNVDYVRFPDSDSSSRADMII